MLCIYLVVVGVLLGNEYILIPLPKINLYAFDNTISAK